MRYLIVSLLLFGVLFSKGVGASPPTATHVCHSQALAQALAASPHGDGLAVMGAGEQASSVQPTGLLSVKPAPAPLVSIPTTHPAFWTADGVLAPKRQAHENRGSKGLNTVFDLAFHRYVPVDLRSRVSRTKPRSFLTICRRDRSLRSIHSVTGVWA